MPLADDDEVEAPTEDQEVVDTEAAKIYKPELSIDERFMLAMENYRKERIFNAITSQILATYFTFGHMDPNQAAALSTSDKEIDIEVDFIYVVSAFLSSFLISASGWYDAEYFTTAPKVVGGFLRYLLHKRVLPEYDTDLRQAIEIAQRAKVEAPKCQKFNKLFPDSFNETCSILYVRDFEYDTLPDDSLECMEQVSGISVASEVELRGKEIRHMRVVSVEPMGLATPSSSPSSTIEALIPEPRDESSKNDKSTDESPKNDESTEEGSKGDLAIEEGSKSDQPNTIAYSKVTLAKLPIGWATDNGTSTTKNAGKEDKKEEHCTIFVSSELASYLDIGTVVWGTFFTLSNGIVFARPLGAHPSFFVEQDEEVSDD
ncbi:MAG: Argonaute siRNA chaperone complex subunit Arb1-domain-containing protein [Linnemannia gamsii]|nr:MAG: Argonaute siRNA chaperone complex subunit Arb1-domain-containing protein [Linnemannia gamsii]